jgi:CRP-like cAMP-binding protein
MEKTLKSNAQANRLLGALEPASRARIESHLVPVTFKPGDIVCEAGGQLDHVYFPQGSILSLLTVLESGAAIETANIGCEGAFGLFAAMAGRGSFAQCLVRMEGGLVRCPIGLLRSEFNRSEYVRDLFVGYSETLLAQAQQTAACNTMHTVRQRLGRWLLMMHDHAPVEALPCTHEILSDALGANRKSVTLGAQAIQAAGLIHYQRGRIRVLDRPGLEKAACECYAAVRNRLDAFQKAPVHANLTGKRKAS